MNAATRNGSTKRSIHTFDQFPAGRSATCNCSSWSCLLCRRWPAACKSERRGIPAEVEAAINAVSDDIATERYEKIYNEASELWRQDASLEQIHFSIQNAKDKTR